MQYTLYHIRRGRGALRAHGASPSDTRRREAARRKPWIGGSVLCPRCCRCAWAAPLPSTPSPAHLPPPASPAPNPNPRVSRCRPPLVAFLCPSPSSPATGRRPLPGSPTSRPPPPPPLRPPPSAPPRRRRGIRLAACRWRMGLLSPPTLLTCSSPLRPPPKQILMLHAVAIEGVLQHSCTS